MTSAPPPLPRRDAICSTLPCLQNAHCQILFKSKTLVLEVAGNHQAALDLTRGDSIIDIGKSDIERVELKLREPRPSR